MSEDITFCVNMRCKMQCERNPRNILLYWLPHSFARFEECEYWEVTVDAAAGMAADRGQRDRQIGVEA